MKVIRVIYWSALTCCCIFVILMTFKNGRGIAPPDKKAGLRMKPVPDTAISAKGIAGHNNVPGGAERVKDTPNITRQHEETLCAVAPLCEEKKMMPLRGKNCFALATPRRV